MTTSSFAHDPHLDDASAHQLHLRFLSILPRIRSHAEVHFRHLKCPSKRADAIAEVTALAWKWFLRLVQQGKDVDSFVSAVAGFAVKHVRSGRLFCGQEPSKDALSPLAQCRRGFVVQALPEHDTCEESNQALDALVDNTHTPPPLQAAFRLDFPRWLSSLGEKHRLLAERLMAGDQACEVASVLNLSPSRVTQIRGELMHDWRRFHGEVA